MFLKWCDPPCVVTLPSKKLMSVLKFNAFPHQVGGENLIDFIQTGEPPAKSPDEFPFAIVCPEGYVPV